MNRIIKSITPAIIFLAILLYAAITPMPTQAMKRESGPATVAAVQAEPVRVILIGPGW